MAFWSVLLKLSIMNSKKETFQNWNKIADLYESKFMDLDIYNQTYDYFLDLIIVEEPRILEVGCGPGNITKYLLSKSKQSQILAIDVAPRMIELAKKNTDFDNRSDAVVSFEVMDCRKVSEIETKFDAILVGFCLPYLSIEETTTFVGDCSNLLNDNGVFYLSFVEGKHLDSGIQVGSSGVRIFFYFHELRAIENILIQNHFENIIVQKVSYERSSSHTEIHTIVTCRKAVSSQL
jgi:2-polyprenyl-3-methyl-5-hydroxy-6-metoxy-1,4-benzoquinol methylase